MEKLTLHGVNVGSLSGLGKWETKLDDWEIVEPLRKLRAKYEAGPTLLFNHYVFAPPKWARIAVNKLLDSDLAAVDCLMGGNISAKTATWRKLVDAELQRSLEVHLSAIPVEVAIEDAQYDDQVKAAIDCLTSVPGVRLAIASKLLTVKRPALIPMMDSVLQGCVGAGEDAGSIIHALRREIFDPANNAALSSLVQAIDDLYGIRVSKLRVLDELIWFDWNLRQTDTGCFQVVGFPSWEFDPRSAHDGVRWINQNASA